MVSNTLGHSGTAKCTGRPSSNISKITITTLLLAGSGMVDSMAWAPCNTKMVKSTRVSSRMTGSKASALSLGRMAESTSEVSLMA